MARVEANQVGSSTFLKSDVAQHIAQLGDTLQGRYAIERELGRGGMATGLFGRRPEAAPASSSPALAPGAHRSARSDGSDAEIEVAARLSHPNILPSTTPAKPGRPLFYAMPYVEGESLRQRLAREPQLP